MQGKRALRRPLNRRRPLLHGSRSLSARQEAPHTVNVPVLPQPEAFDPDMLYVECGHCGAPIVWEKGRTRRLLAEAGYDGGSCGRCVATLIRRFRQGADFPHEIGLFLSYPPEDVKGFVDNRARSYKCAGLWKVYSDEARARRLFTRFKRCTDTYCKLWQAGATIDQLAVAG